LNQDHNEQKFLGSFFKKEQKKALLFEKRSKNFWLLVACPGGTSIPLDADSRLPIYSDN
jgi:hypothetical protein